MDISRHFLCCKRRPCSFPVNRPRTLRPVRICICMYCIVSYRIVSYRIWILLVTISTDRAFMRVATSVHCSIVLGNGFSLQVNVFLCLQQCVFRLHNALLVDSGCFYGEFSVPQRVPVAVVFVCRLRGFHGLSRHENSSPVSNSKHPGQLMGETS